MIFSSFMFKFCYQKVSRDYNLPLKTLQVSLLYSMYPITTFKPTVQWAESLSDFAFLQKTRGFLWYSSCMTKIHENNSAKYFKNGRLNKDPLKVTLLSGRLLGYVQFPNRGRVVRNRTVEKNKDCLYLSPLVIKCLVMELNLTVVLATWRQNHNRETQLSSYKGIHTNKQSNKKKLQK